MEDLNTLRIKKKLLLIELNALEQKISLLETNETSSPSSTTVTFEQEGETLKSKAIPEQTAPGKEKSNPLIADALLKSMNSKLININDIPAKGNSKMTILNPSSSKNLDLIPDYKKALNKDPERFYVIYKGPRSGVYTDWGIVEKICSEDKVTCKKFRNQESANFSLATANSVIPIPEKELLRPKALNQRILHKDQRFEIPKEIKEEINNQTLTFRDFRDIWNKARAACSEDFLSEKFYTTDKKNKSLYNFVEGADPKLVHQAFLAGLVDNIYPSSNLQELMFFPSKMIDTIKTFRRKVLKAKNNPIFVRIISSIPDWYQQERFDPYYFIQFGLASNKKEVTVSQPMNDSDFPEEKELLQIRVNGLKRIAEKVLESLSSEDKKVNYVASNYIITSWSPKSSNEDLKALSKFGEKFMKNNLQASQLSVELFCKHANQLFEDHACNYCSNNNSTKVDPSTTKDDEESSSSTQ